LPPPCNRAFLASGLPMRWLPRRYFLSLSPRPFPNPLAGVFAQPGSQSGREGAAESYVRNVQQFSLAGKKPDTQRGETRLVLKRFVARRACFESEARSACDLHQTFSARCLTIGVERRRNLPPQQRLAELGAEAAKTAALNHLRGLLQAEAAINGLLGRRDKDKSPVSVGRVRNLKPR